jgi:uncharacterized protein (TIGR00369 family)
MAAPHDTPGGTGAASMPVPDPASFEAHIPAPALMQAMGGHRLLEVDADAGRVRVAFNALPEFCHSNATIVQGGFITAWMDFAMAFATLTHTRFKSNIASLEIKVSFLERVGPGEVVAEGQVLRLGRKVAFLEGRLFDPQGRLAAVASSSAVLVPHAGRPTVPG